MAATRNETAAILGQFEADRSEAQAGAPLPAFLVIGPPRTGTTWLYDVLSSRALLPGPTKETRFFDVHFDRGLDWYLHHFPANTNRLTMGEVAPTYFASPVACTRIFSVLPHARLVIIFRNPVQRLISLYRLKRAYGLHAWTLDQALERDPELLASSQYATHLKMWQSCFPPEQLSVHFFDDLVRDPQRFMEGVCDSIGIPRFDLQDAERKQVFSSTGMTEPRIYAATRAALAVADWCKARKLDRIVHHVRRSRAFNLLVGGGAPFPPIPDQSLARLRSLLSREIEELEGMVGRDLSHWKIPAKA
jgi:hypothetical protein